MSKNFKEIVRHEHTSEGFERRENLLKEIMVDSTSTPSTVTYQDIDTEFKKWVENELEIEIEGERAKTLVLYSNQRFSEYMQSWEFNDDNRNLLLNFKTVTRENNPGQGKINDGIMNVPGDRYYTIKKVYSIDENGKGFNLVYKMKQPKAVDFKYQVNFVTNLYSNLNKFNEMVIDKFKSINCYIRPNGHYMAMKLESISDESEYMVKDRQYFSQAYTVILTGYIISESDFKVEQEPILKFKGVDYDLSQQSKCSAEIEEFDIDENLKYPVSISVDLALGVGRYSFTSDLDVKITGITCSNITSLILSINDDDIQYIEKNSSLYDEVDYDFLGTVTQCKFNEIVIKNNSKVKIKKIINKENNKNSKIILNGYKII